MNSLEKRIIYRATLGALPLMVAFGVGCTNPAGELPPVFSVIPSASSPFAKETPLPTAIPATTLPPAKDTPRSFTPTAQSAPKPDSSPETNTTNDANIKRQVEQAKGGEVIIINNGRVERLFRVPWVTGTALIATLGDTAAVLTQADCVFDALKENNKLGSEKFGSWNPNERIDSMQARISIPATVASPVPFLDLQKIIYKGKSFTCHEVTAGEKLKELLHKINWKNLPENIGEVLGNITGDFLRGLRGGFLP